MSAKPSKIGIILGGTSEEREYAEKSANDIFSALKYLRYKPIKIDFDKYILDNLNKNNIDLAFIIDATFIGTKKQAETINKKSLRHLLEDLNIPYTGSSLKSAETTKNKIASKIAFIRAGLSTPPYELVNLEIPPDQEAKRIIDNLQLPVIIKPRDEGSSIGIAVVKSYDSLVDAIRSLRKRFEYIFVEKYIKGKEVTVSVVELNSKLKSLPVIEINHKAEFYSREIKLTDFRVSNQSKNSSLFYIPARLKKNLYKKVQKVASVAHKAVCCSGYSRVDIIVDSKNTPQILEINSLPVLESKDFVAWSARVEGIPYETLIEGIIKTAWNKFRALPK
ncbi:MAG: ATP-grasp domain-containing protein [bacterium]|nr:ATP-grasp domain-containing protein [bacterium]